MNRIYLISTILGLVLFLPSSYPQTSRVDYLEFIYVENSRIGTEGGLSEAQLLRLGSLLEEVDALKKARTWLFISDGEEPMASKNKKGKDNLYSQLFERNQGFPADLVSEQKRIWNTLESEDLIIGKNIRIHVFVTDYFLANKLETIWPLMFHYLPSEANFMYGTPVEVKYYLNRNMKSFVFHNDANWLNQLRVGMQAKVVYSFELL